MKDPRGSERGSPTRGSRRPWVWAVIGVTFSWAVSAAGETRPESGFIDEYPWQFLLLVALAALSVGLIFGIFSVRRSAGEVQRELMAQRDAMSQVSRLAMLGELTASISHEVSQPLGAILASADTAEVLLKRCPPAVDDALRSIALIKRAGARAGDVTNRVRTLVRRHPIDPVLLDVNVLIAEAWPLVEGRIRRGGVSWEHRLAPWLPFVYADKGELQQVLMNLVLNALEAMRSGTESGRLLVVSTSVDADREVRVEVADTGHGLQVEPQKMFERFFTTKSDGMGLGLAIALSIIEAHGGTLTARNNTPAGAVFRFTIPVTTRPHAAQTH